ncbi:MAG: hypothetical protein LAQ30_05670 [Acidobacteriia bacterium]|nr:hypothetical protein [Terriglobia bacterium]
MERNREHAELDAALADLDEVWSLLRRASPAALDRCSVVLEGAAQRLRQWRAGEHQAPAGPAVLARARALRSAVRGAGRLLESAAAFHGRWRNVLGCLCAGYTPSGGSPAPAPAAGRLCLRG